MPTTTELRAQMASRRTQQGALGSRDPSGAPNGTVPAPLDPASQNALRDPSGAPKPVNQYADAPPAPPAPPATAQLSATAPTLPAAVPPTVPSIAPTNRGSSFGGGADPRDAQYYADIAKLNYTVNVGEATLDLQGQEAKATHDRQAATLAHQNALDQVGLRQSMARSGLGYSTTAGENLGNLEYTFASNLASNDQELYNFTAAANLQRQALESGYTVDEASALAAAYYRKAQQDAINAANAPAPTPAAAPAAPAPPAYPGGPSSNPAYGPSTHPGAGPPGSGYQWVNNRWSKAPKSAGPPPTATAWWNGVRWVK